MKRRVRIDRLLVERGLAPSREKAQARVMAGEVLADEQKVEKPGHAVPEDCEIRLLGEPPPYVSRGGFKLQGALDHFGIDVRGCVCLDVGASTGGFTDCLLQRGARRVYAVDTGANQLDWKLRQDGRVIVREKVNARYIDREIVPEPVSFACCDVSFISATLILPALPPLLDVAADLVILVKPQFEVGKGEVGKGGIVKDPALHEQAVDRVRVAAGEIGFTVKGVIESPILGAEGNREFLLHAAWCAR
jgi:23S rRNA (cytidine1920-2'-O)/16S rRNA (cytidine1409-2'-O)-methyltransferase